MADLLSDAPANWVSKRPCTPQGFIEELKRRHTLAEWEENFAPFLKEDGQKLFCQPRIWCDEILYVRILLHEYGSLDGDVLDLLGRILCQALEVPRDCTRKLSRKDEPEHTLVFFTNYRAIQVYCCHNLSEQEALIDLREFSIHFRLHHINHKLEGLTYDEYTRNLFYRTSHCVAWECIFPEGIDMEALSPRDANANIRAKQAAPKSKAAPAKLPQKEKDHPLPPPENVQEPPSSDRPNGAIYKSGRLLGKGGFAICYEGEQIETKRKYALKIVKSHMPQKKMEQKFQTELQIHSKMRHANIVEFHRAFSFEKCTYIVLELCPNGSLMDMVKKRKYITEPEVRFWTVQIAGAIKYMHTRGIIHRDLKMGNIFLDKNMNVKVGDFGLAALLMTGKDWKDCRRTTLCGTPNYIAPEILSKDKGGHDHAVDIWSLGIIIFAMLTGKPPFQSATADEIYRRAREREYDWPKLDTSENFISQETKDLVSELLQPPEQRPDPDTIVQHPFFTCGWMPQPEEMTPLLRDKHPDPNQFLSVGARGGKTNLYLRNLKKLCIKCEVGPWHTSLSGYISTYREVAAEEKAGLTPKVPLPEDVVYRPFHEWLEEQATPQKPAGQRSSSGAMGGVLPPSSSSRAENLPLPSHTRPTTQSFAAQQRSRPQVSAANPSNRTANSRQPACESSVRSGPSIPNRSTKSTSRKVESKTSEDTVDVENRLAVDLVQELNSAENERKSSEAEAPTISLEISESLFNPQEKLESLPTTKPDHVLEGLRRLQVELERALNSRTTAVENKKTPPVPTIVVKWVDYTNKFGLGYILSNGSVGCIFKATAADSEDPSKGLMPPCCVVVRDAERHLQNRANEAYVDRHQIVPISGPNIEFYENRGEKGVFRGKVNPQNYKVQVTPEGDILRLARGRDDWDNRKREKIMLWKKFANYMTAYGRDQDYPFDDTLARTQDQAEFAAAGNVVTFYQRWGDVGCWFFADGHFQFNFPDHTKLIISADGTWCDFYHLPLEAARDFAAKGTLPSSALDDRQRLSYPLQTLLNFMSKPSRAAKSTARKRMEINPMLQGIPAANDFRKKVEFIRLVVKEWVLNGGLGISDMTPEGRLRWNGSRELVNVKVPYKHVWATVGGKKGDERRVIWFNPRKPNEIVPDVK